MTTNTTKPRVTTRAGRIAEEIVDVARQNAIDTAREAGWTGDHICWPGFAEAFNASLDVALDDRFQQIGRPMALRVSKILSKERI